MEPHDKDEGSVQQPAGGLMTREAAVCAEVELLWHEDGTEEINPHAANWRAEIDKANARPKRTRLQQWIDWQEQEAALKHARLDAEYRAIVRG